MLAKPTMLRTGFIGGVVLSGLLLLVIGANVARAADDTTATTGREEIAISPAVEKIDAQPGEVKSGELTVINSGDTEYSFIVYARPYSVETQNYAPNYSDTPQRSTLYRWVQFDVTEGKLAPGEKQKVNYTIMVPDDAEAGGAYGVLFAETVADTSSQQVIARNKRVGSIVRLSVGGDIKRAGQLESQSIDWLQTRPPIKTEALVSNSGNIDFDATTVTSVKTVFGREVYNAKADHVVYPGKPRHIVTQWEGSSVFGLFRVEQTIDVLGQTSKKQSYVLVMPRWALMLLAMAVVAGGAYAAYRRLR